MARDDHPFAVASNQLQDKLTQADYKADFHLANVEKTNTERGRGTAIRDGARKQRGAQR